LRFLAAIEIIESDLWQQYNELALGNESYQQALNVLDGDEATYVKLNTRDEFSHANFINKYLEAKGHRPVSLEPFRILPSSQATGPCLCPEGQGLVCRPRETDIGVTMRELRFDELTTVCASSHGMRSRIPPTEITHQDMGFAGDHVLESFEGNCIRGARFSRSGDPLF
jgi:hypothetical protein